MKPSDRAVSYKVFVKKLVSTLDKNKIKGPVPGSSEDVQQLRKKLIDSLSKYATQAKHRDTRTKKDQGLVEKRPSEKISKSELDERASNHAPYIRFIDDYVRYTFQGLTTSLLNFYPRATPGQILKKNQFVGRRKDRREI
jgi:hypothetical protein